MNSDINIILTEPDFVDFTCAGRAYRVSSTPITCDIGLTETHEHLSVFGRDMEKTGSYMRGLKEIDEKDITQWLSENRSYWLDVTSDFVDAETDAVLDSLGINYGKSFGIVGDL